MISMQQITIGQFLFWFGVSLTQFKISWSKINAQKTRSFLTTKLWQNSRKESRIEVWIFPFLWLWVWKLTRSLSATTGTTELSFDFVNNVTPSKMEFGNSNRIQQNLVHPTETSNKSWKYRTSDWLWIWIGYRRCVTRSSRLKNQTIRIFSGKVNLVKQSLSS